MSRRTASFLVLLLTFTAPAWAQAPAAHARPRAAAAAKSANPLLQAWTTPFQVPPFDAIKTEHFLPAFTEAIAEQRREIDVIVRNPKPATFPNTIEALDRAGETLTKVSGVFQNLSGADTNEQLQAIGKEVTPMLSALRDEIRLNPQLFARVKAVYDARNTLKLTPVQRRLVEETYKGYVRGGANLDEAKKEQLKGINRELSMLSLEFGERLLHDTNAYKLVIEKEADLQGLPPAVIAAAAARAKKAGLQGKWLFTLEAPSIWPFLQYADNRELRRQMLTAYLTRCDHNDQFDTKAIITKIAALRAQRAALFGYKTFADMTLEDNMAKTPDQVYAFLQRLWTPAREVALKEAAALQEQVKAGGGDFQVESWDWRYYTEKLRKARYDVDEQAVRQYFQLDRVRDGAFHVAHRLYGISFTPRPDLPVYNKEVQAFEVKDADGSHLGVFYADFHPRPGKRVGAWTSRFRGTSVRNGRRISPIVVIVCNFSRPVGTDPALLSIEEATTLFHEFGHALHSLLSKVPYGSLGSVPRDFVELPSQIMENWVLEPDVLKVYAKHYTTGAPIPADLVKKIEQSEKFNQGFATVEYLAASLLDMDWHTLTPDQAAKTTDAGAFEAQSMAKIHMPSQIPPRYRSPYYSHIWGGGYSAGYYSYIWAEVLDKDAFEAFKEKGLFDQDTARSFRKNVLEKGGTEDAMAMYKAFRGREPSVEPLLKARGLK